MTARTVDRVLPFYARQAKLIFAGRTFAKNVCLAIAETVSLELEKAPDATEKAQKCLVFTLTLVNIS